MGSPLRVGIAGIGIAARQVLPGFATVPGAEFSAVADVREDELDRFREEYGVETFRSVEAMCQSDAVDAVWVATPNHLHAKHAVMAATHGKHVICEKPMAISLEEADRMVAAVERNGVKYVQGHSRIYQHSVRKMGEIIRSGRLGKLFHINTSMYNDWLRRPVTPAEVDESRGGGVVYRQGPHQMDIVRFLGGGMVRSVRGVAGRLWNPPFDIEGNYAAFLDFEDGATAQVSLNGYGHFDVTELTWGIGEGGRPHTGAQITGPRHVPRGPVRGEEKYNLPAYSIEEISRTHGTSEAQDFFGLTVVSCEHGDIRQSPNGLYVYTDEGREEILLPNQMVRDGELRELVAAVSENRPSFPDARWGKATLETCLAIIQSSRERREVELSSQVPAPEFLPLLTDDLMAEKA
jgi:phthalate 4,5-cis-dihydrodiol dehydrogenase